MRVVADTIDMNSFTYKSTSLICASALMSIGKSDMENVDEDIRLIAFTALST